MLLHVGIVGDFDAGKHSHRATNDALRHAADGLRWNVSANWLPTASFERADALELLAGQDAILAAPGSPYTSMEGMLAGIRFARLYGVPFLGTCGGFQYTLIEYARNVLGLDGADTEENGRATAAPVITAVACPVANRRNGAPKLSGGCRVRLAAGTMLARIYATHSPAEEYFCNFEVNPDYLRAFEQAGLRLSAFGEGGELRAVELPGHPFFAATLFQPQLSSTDGHPHPLITAFLKAARARRETPAWATPESRA
jgi:CTP synthase (UTP-ammonia lyase)